MTKHTSMSIFPVPGDAKADSLGFIFCVLSNLNGVTHLALLPIFCLSVIFTAMNKALRPVQPVTLPLKRLKKTSCHNSGGTREEFLRFV